MLDASPRLSDQEQRDLYNAVKFLFNEEGGVVQPGGERHSRFGHALNIIDAVQRHEQQKQKRTLRRQAIIRAGRDLMDLRWALSKKRSLIDKEHEFFKDFELVQKELTRTYKRETTLDPDKCKQLLEEALFLASDGKYGVVNRLNEKQFAYYIRLLNLIDAEAELFGTAPKNRYLRRQIALAGRDLNERDFLALDFRVRRRCAFNPFRYPPHRINLLIAEATYIGSEGLYGSPRRGHGTAQHAWTPNEARKKRNIIRNLATYDAG